MKYLLNFAPGHYLNYNNFFLGFLVVSLIFLSLLLTDIIGKWGWYVFGVFAALTVWTVWSAVSELRKLQSNYSEVISTYKYTVGPRRDDIDKSVTAQGYDLELKSAKKDLQRANQQYPVYRGEINIAGWPYTMFGGDKIEEELKSGKQIEESFNIR